MELHCCIHKMWRCSDCRGQPQELSSKSTIVMNELTFIRNKNIHTLKECMNLQSQYYLVLILIYLLTAIGLPPTGSSTVHIYTQKIHRTTQKCWKSAGHAPSLRVIPWHLPYNWGKSTEKPQSGYTQYIYIYVQYTYLSIQYINLFVMQ